MEKDKLFKEWLDEKIERLSTDVNEVNDQNIKECLTMELESYKKVKDKFNSIFESIKNNEIKIKEYVYAVLTETILIKLFRTIDKAEKFKKEYGLPARIIMIEVN